MTVLGGSGPTMLHAAHHPSDDGTDEIEFSGAQTSGKILSKSAMNRLFLS